MKFFIIILIIFVNADEKCSIPPSQIDKIVMFVNVIGTLMGEKNSNPYPTTCGDEKILVNNQKKILKIVCKYFKNN